MAPKTCVICGAPSGMYIFCKKCNKLKDEGKIVKCEKCSKWHLTDKVCDCSIEDTKPVQMAEPEIAPTSGIHIPCLLCGKDAKDKHFCMSCYSKYKDHSIIVKIDNCTDATIEEKYADGQRYTCKDGHVVRSKSEKDIDNFLFDHNIAHAYEKKFDVDGVETIKPDFYLPTLDLYIEHWGYENSSKYNKEKEYKLKVYREKKTTIICTYESDMEDTEFNLKRKLDNYKNNEINYLK